MNKKHNRRTAIVHALTTVLCCAWVSFTPGCGKSEQASSGAAQRQMSEQVVATAYPPAYIASRLLGDTVEVVCLLESGQHAAAFVPSREQILQTQRARAIVANGATLETWLRAVSLPTSRIVESSSPFPGRWLELEDVIEHSHGAGGMHSHRGTNGATWLHPGLLSLQAQHVSGELARLLPDQSDTIASNLPSLLEDIRRVEEAVSKIVVDPRITAIASTDPAYAYVAEAVGMEFIQLREGETPPTAAVVLVDQADTDAGLSQIGLAVAFPMLESPPVDGVSLVGSLEDSYRRLADVIATADD